ncbi:hypothetical protein QQP08_013743 [Theobroma cacao]|nr:hypothetical protein QQP08_013743 [Theobroma cacao]
MSCSEIFVSSYTYRVLAASGPHWEALEMLSTCIDASSLSLLTKIGLWFLGLWVFRQIASQVV